MVIHPSIYLMNKIRQAIFLCFCTPPVTTEYCACQIQIVKLSSPLLHWKFNGVYYAFVQSLSEN